MPNFTDSNFEDSIIDTPEGDLGDVTIDESLSSRSTPNSNSSSTFCEADNDSENENLYEQFDCFKNKGLHFIHINARSLISKSEEIRLLVKAWNPAVLAISESWLDSSVNDSEITIQGYLCDRKDSNRQGGGVSLFIREDLAYNRRNDLCSENLEFLAIDLLLPKTKPILVGVG